MAGYLGTLFMGGVGLRLILPPATQFNKLVGRLQKGLQNAGNVGEAISNRFAKRRKAKLVRDVSEAGKLIKSLEQSADVEKMTRLRTLLKHIEAEHGLSMTRALARIKGLKGRLKTEFGAKGMSDLDADRIKAHESKLTDLEKGFAKLGPPIVMGTSMLIGMAKTLLGIWANAIRQSVMWIITFGFQMGMLVKGFMEFEKELINANSIFQTTRENLYAMSDELIKFGYRFGINYGDASKVLYQFASAGLSASDSMKILKDTLTLTMAVQGDFNTLGKLMVQVIKGFSLEMSQSSEIADKFAYTINKSLIEWKDLSAAVKFAMPFFVAAGQSVDQLLGSLQILTDRALEAGIAGRGLRQAIAQFVEHADDNNAAFRKLGVEILDAEGNMRALTDIALQFEAAMGEDVSQMDIMMTLMQDLNIRGATAFVHLAQNATEFDAAVKDLANSQGEANKMAEYQQASLTNQIQLLKNAIYSIFYLSDATYAGTGALNGFDYAIKSLVETLKSSFLVTLADGTIVLTEFGLKIRDVAIKFVTALGDVLIKIMDIFVNLSESGFSLFDTVSMLFVAIKGLVDFLSNLPPGVLKLAFQVWLMTNLFGGAPGLIGAFAMALVQLGRTLESIHPILEKIVWLVSTLVGAIIGLVTLGLPLGLIFGGIGAIVGGTIGMLGGPVGAFGGFVAGGTAGLALGTGIGAYGGAKMYGAGKSLAGEGYYGSAGGSPAPIASYSYDTSSTTMNVGYLNVANDSLNERFDSAYSVSNRTGERAGTWG